MKGKKVWIVIGVIIIIFAILIGIRLTQKTAPKEQVIKIGAILPLTGELAFVGEHEKNSIMLALKESPSRYIRVIIEDCASNPKNALSAAQKLIVKDRINILITSPSFISESVKSLAEKENIPHFIWAYHPTLPLESKMIFRYFVNSFDESEMFIKFIIDQKIKKVAFLRHMHPDAERAFREKTYPKLHELGITVFDLPYPLTLTDFTPLIMKLNDIKPELVVIQGFAPFLVKIYKKMKELGIKCRILGDVNFTELETKVDKEMLAGIPFVGETFILDPKYKEFEERYKKEYGIYPLPFNALCYDLIKYLSKYAEYVKGVYNLRNFLSYVNSTPLDGISGKVRFDENGETKINYDYLVYDSQGDVKKWER